MHIVIYSLVEASTHDHALATGKTMFDRLVGADAHAGAVFDYYVTFDENDTTVAGKARWGDLPTAAPIDSDDDQDLLNRGWEATKEEFERNLDRVKEAVDELSDEEIMRDGVSPGTPSTRSVRTMARRSSRATYTRTAFATVDTVPLLRLSLTKMAIGFIFQTY